MDSVGFSGGGQAGRGREGGAAAQKERPSAGSREAYNCFSPPAREKEKGKEASEREREEKQGREDEGKTRNEDARDVAHFLNLENKMMLIVGEKQEKKRER